MKSSKPRFPVLHYLQRLAQTHVHWVNNAIQSFHPLSSSSPPALNLSHHQGLPMSWHFTARGQRIGASALTSFFFNEYSGLISFGIDRSDLPAVPGTLKNLLQHYSSNTTDSSTLGLLYGPTLTPIHDYWKNYSSDDKELCRQSDVSAW